MTSLNRKFLLSEIHRFYNINGVVPTARDFCKGSGYPSVQAYKNEFGLWSVALETAGYKVKRVRNASDKIVDTDIPSHIIKNVPKHLRRYTKRYTGGYIPPTKLSDILEALNTTPCASSKNLRYIENEAYECY